MRLIPFTTYEAALAADLRAMEYLRANDGAKGGQWSGVYVDYGTPTRYAITYAPAIDGALTPEELASVEDGEPLVRENGQFISGNWEPYTPPQPEEE